MERFLGRYSEAIYCVMRLMVGLTFAQHGAQKLLGLLGGQKMPLGSMSFSWICFVIIQRPNWPSSKLNMRPKVMYWKRRCSLSRRRETCYGTTSG